MNTGLETISPLAAYLGSFIAAEVPSWLLVFLAVTLHWGLLLVPSVAVLGFLDRKMGADVQMRIGPNRVPMSGFFQSLADTVKLFFKEDKRGGIEHGWLFSWGIIVSITSLFSALGLLPVAESWSLSNVDSGAVLVLFAMVFSHLCLFWTAYSAPSRWSTVSAFRILPVIASYIVPLAIALIPVVLVAGSANFDQIARAQGGLPWKWILFHNPGSLLSGITMFVALLIWQSRNPFDHYLARGEIDAGFVACYSGLRKGLIYFLEYVSLLLALGFMVATYMGGWQTPFNLATFGRASNLVHWLVFSAKALFLGILCIWIRWSLPRLRSDQIITLSWRILVPMGLVGAMVTSLWLVLFNGRGFGDFI